ncbi:MAG: hypothetical protein ACPGTP_07610 [Bacteroidia bacterium]
MKLLCSTLLLFFLIGCTPEEEEWINIYEGGPTYSIETTDSTQFGPNLLSTNIGDTIYIDAQTQDPKFGIRFNVLHSKYPTKFILESERDSATRTCLTHFDMDIPIFSYGSRYSSFNTDSTSKDSFHFDAFGQHDLGYILTKSSLGKANINVRIKIETLGHDEYHYVKKLVFVTE